MDINFTQYALTDKMLNLATSFRNHVEAVYDGEIKESQSPLLSSINENELSILRNIKAVDKIFCLQSIKS